ncbi:hypothetical protein [Fructobacillus fructosus]|nr:hypothetical protein [Fructobacillus fructosus]MBC9119427.1 hypothetical protein [Fructobacillus fructosus]MBD9367013.1 hypothetical protein [Leuconostoc mesenteroides]
MKELEFILLSCVAMPYVLYYVGGIIAIGQESQLERKIREEKKKEKMEGR